MGTLILIRHGQSVWNAENRFTGWVDTPLSAKGREEAHLAGRRLAQQGARVDVAFTSTLSRAIETGRTVLDELGQAGLEQIQAWELNERFYGALTGRDKAQTAEEFGADQVKIWRRSYDIPPPGGESLKDTANRTLPYFRREVLPRAQQEQTVLVAAHGNSLRSIVKELDRLDDEAIIGVEIATAIPLVYMIASDATVKDKRVIES